ncbi:MAG: hypothetical protein ABJC12_06185 [Saprospiraceae bacterium]
MASLLSLRRNMISIRHQVLSFHTNFNLLRFIRLAVCLCAFLVFISDSHATCKLVKTFSDTEKESCMSQSSSSMALTDTMITMRFGNPRYDCDSSQFLVDVEFQSNVNNQRIFGINMRFWYNDADLEYIRFKMIYPLQYSAFTPNPAEKYILPPYGPLWFGFQGAAVWINGAVQLTNVNQPPVYITTSTWTKVFSIAFHIDTPNPNPEAYYASVIGDLEADPAQGGFLPQTEGIVITVINIHGASSSVKEGSVPFNWNYSGNGSAPYGAPANINPATLQCAPIINCPGNITIACGDSSLPANTGTATATDFCANGGAVVTFNDSQTGGTCPQSNLITRIWKATDNCGFTTYCPQYITVGTGTFCNLLVSNTGDSGIGSLRDAISCASPGDTIIFHPSLAGTTILVNTSKLILNKNLFIRSSITPRVKIKSTIAGLFDITAGNTIEVKDLDITSGIATTPANSNGGAAFNNLGVLKLIGVKVYRNPSLASGQYLIRNKPSSQFTLSGSCFIQYN